MNQLPNALRLVLAVVILPLVTAVIDCDGYVCGHNRVQVCHFNGKEFQTLCIRQNSVLRKPQNSATEDYCGPCTSHKPFESTEELRKAVSQYVDKNHYDVELAETYGWPLSNWNVSLITDFSEVFAHSSINEDLGEWDVGQATSMAKMFWHNDAFESGGIWRWDVSKVTTMERMFLGASKFNGDVRDWYTRSLTNLVGTFWRATSFNQDIGYWDTSQVSNASRLFAEASKFDQDLSGWNTAKMSDLSYMFLQATSFQQDLSEWDLSNAVTLERMLYQVPAYETSVDKQDALLTAWQRQWQTAGRLVNTEDMFSCEKNNDQEEQEAVVRANTYMRGRGHLFRLKTASSFQAQQHNTTTSERTEADTPSATPTPKNGTETTATRCNSGACVKQ